ncbi:hypothetical protein E2562_012920 [Oryza meyeriana var. granulata]|uniref:Uncharacterized protein n=1 Tax=Oryza meyeriana var. granulata TaxID=110450 RepID=A0A6G1CF07_9ORYZ|nr:hypothetical protein E2562_012920 [Oryza meyeriana var. granulata]
MAAAEARAAWQRAANRCLVQEDRKRAPKLACCPSSSEQQHGKNNGNCRNSEDRPVRNFMPLSWNPMNSNLPPDIRWCLQLQPNLAGRKNLAGEHLYFLGREISEKEVEDSASETTHGEPLFCEMFDTNPEKIEDVFEPSWMVSTAFPKHSSEICLQEMKNIGGYSQVPQKCKGNISDCSFDDKEFLDFKNFSPLPSKNPQKADCDIDAPWKGGERSQPWWQITDENELALLVAQRAMRHIENCDLPRPTQTVRVQGTESRIHENMGRYGGPSCPAGTMSYPDLGQCEHIECSCSTGSTTSTDELDLTNDGVWQRQERNVTHSDAQYLSRSANTEPRSKQTYQNPAERAQLLEALCHSQTRAREAEMAGKKAQSEKDDVLKLLFRQASHLFACKQWLKMLQLENICLQLKHKEQQIATMIPDLPCMAQKKRTTTDEEREDWTRKKGKRRKNGGGGFFDAILLAVGLGIAGAGLLLGWTFGWLLAKL